MFRWLGWGKSKAVQKKPGVIPKASLAADDNVANDDNIIYTEEENNTALFSKDAISKYQQHLVATADLYRQKEDSWQKLAIEIEKQLPADYLDRAHEHHASVSQQISAVFKTLGKVICDLHRLVMPANHDCNDIIDDIHKDLYQTRLLFAEQMKKLETGTDCRSKEDLLLLKFQLLKTGIKIWEELILLEENVAALIRNCLAEQKRLETLANAGAGVLFAIILASLGNYDGLQNLCINNICWEDTYRDYLTKTLNPGKQKVDLMEVNLGGTLAKGEELVKTVNNIVAKPNNQGFFVAKHTQAIDELNVLPRSHSSPSVY